METIILFAPLVGALIAGFGYKTLGEKLAITTATVLLFVSAALSWWVFLKFDGQMQQIPIMRWIDSGSLSVDWSIRVDRLTTVMLVVVTTVSSLVHLYSFGYMKDDPQFKKGESYEPRFFAYLGFFTFAMLALVTADNLLQLYFGWEGVGVASYLLIGFYYRKPSAGAAAIKAFVVNRVGDFGFAIAIFALFFLVDGISFADVFAAGPKLAAMKFHFLWMDVNAVEMVTFFLFMGAMGKSAQLFLHTWLPDAMEGPTPVSALIHAATMVTAGVFLVVRMSPLFEFAPGTLAFVTVIGSTTAFIAASIGLVQNDVKRVIAYSTMSQLGYMFAAAGVGFYQAAMFHLFTHAFFKAMLFLGAGSIITAMHHEQDMRNYGGLRDKIPVTFWAMLIGTLAITGVGIPASLLRIGETPIGFAGFVSKDAIIEGTYAAGSSVGQYAYVMLVLAAAMTAFYSWRLIFMTFYGPQKGDKHAHENAHESGWTMTVPLIVLAVGASLAGMLWYGDFVGEKAQEFFGVSIFTGAGNDVLRKTDSIPELASLAPFIAMLVGFGLAWMFYIWRPAIPGALAERFSVLYRLLLNKYYFDEIYDFLFTQNAKRLGRFLWKRGDGTVIDGTINGVALRIVPYVTRLTAKAQSGYVYHYALATVVGLVGLVTWMTISGGAN